MEPNKPRAGNPNFKKGKPNQYYPEENKRRAALANSNSQHPTFDQCYGITPKANPTKRKRYYFKIPVISVRTKNQRKVLKIIISVKSRNILINPYNMRNSPIVYFCLFIISFGWLILGLLFTKFSHWLDYTAGIIMTIITIYYLYKFLDSLTKQ